MGPTRSRKGIHGSPGFSEEAHMARLYRRLGLWLFVLPGMMVVLAVAIYPLIYTLRMSFTDFYLPRPPGKFVGLTNYKATFAEQYFGNSLEVTATFVVGACLLELILGMMLALLMNSKVRGRTFFRAAFMVPLMVPPIVGAMNWKALLHPTYGAYNYYLRFILGPDFVGDWLANQATALPTLIVIDAWQWTPFVFLVLLAGLQGVPPEMYEAAQIDGAGRWQSFWAVTVPMLRNVIMAAVLIRMIDALKMFDMPYIMTEGGPGIATETLSFLIYKMGLKFYRIGQASAYAVLYLIGVTLLAMVVQRALRRERVAR
jgi:multiple sugar transport system permease protein